MPNKRNIKFNGWAAEQRHDDLLRSIYGKNPAQLRQLWQDLPADIQADSDIRSTFALCFLRLADLESAKVVDPDVFDVDETKLFGAIATHRLARLLIWLYLKNLRIILVTKNPAHSVCCGSSKSLASRMSTSASTSTTVSTAASNSCA